MSRPEQKEYDRLHNWVRKHLGRPMKCSKCETTEKRRYYWANLSGNYHWDLADWSRLCASCHMKMDLFKSHCPQGHEFTKENTRIREHGWRQCRICTLTAAKKYNLRKKLSKQS